jgi:hypothetical protein
MKALKNAGEMAVRIPREYERAFETGEAWLSEHHGTLIIEPVRNSLLYEVLMSLDRRDVADDDSGDVDDPHPADDVDL